METARIARTTWLGLCRDLLTALLVSGLAAMAVVVLLLLTRRMAGALVEPLGGFSLVAITGLGLLLVFGWRLGWQSRGGRLSSLALVAPALPGVALFTLLCVLSLPGTASWSLMLAWLAFLIGEVVWWWTAYSSQAHPVAGRTVLATVSVVSERASQEDVECNPGSLPKDAFQQVTRFQDGDQERVAVMLRVPFAAGQRVTVTHVAFCPPLCGIPELAAEVMDGSPATVAITSPQTFGVRLEVRLDEPADEPCAVEVELAGETHQPNADREAM